MNETGTLCWGGIIQVLFPHVQAMFKVNKVTRLESFPVQFPSYLIKISISSYLIGLGDPLTSSRITCWGQPLLEVSSS